MPKEEKMNKKILLIPFALFLVMMLSSLALAVENQNTSFTPTFPINNISFSSNSATIKLNTTVHYNVTNVTMTGNATNVTWYVIKGTNETFFRNSTVNGTRTTPSKADFTYTIPINGLSEGIWVITAEVRIEYNLSAGLANTTNSSPLTLTIDKTRPSVSLERPHNRESISPSEGIVTLEYTFTETNAGNATLYVSGAVEERATSNTITPNITTGKTNSFSKTYSADDSSETYIVEVTDLAGNKQNSTSFTYSVIFSGGEIQQRQFDSSGQPIQTQDDVQRQQALSVSPPAGDGNVFIDWLLSWGWIAIIVIAVVIFIYKKRQNS